MLDKLKNTPLFMGFSKEEIEECLKSKSVEIVSYEKDEMIFMQGDTPKKLLILLEGIVLIGNDSGMGDRSIMAVFKNTGELFGEVFLFLGKKYNLYAKAEIKTKILQISRDVFYSHENGEPYSLKLISNMLKIFAGKTYYLNNRLQVLSCATLRQKIASYLLQYNTEKNRVKLHMNREELSAFLNTARPSLSRELMKMQDEGLISIDKNYIYIKDIEALKYIL